MNKLIYSLALAAAVPLAAAGAQSGDLFPTDGGGNWQVSCTVIATDAPPIGPCNGTFSDAVRVTATPGGWSAVPVGGDAYYISSYASASIWGSAPNENPHYEYTFQTMFDVPGAGGIGQLSLDVFWLDNYWVGWSLNGSPFSAVGMSPSPAGPNGGNWTTPFELAIAGASFVSGQNTLQLRIQGNGRTDGILVQGDWELPDTPQEVVPEPATMTLLATGLAGMAAARRKRRKG